jgi:hypothetical protein
MFILWASVKKMSTQCDSFSADIGEEEKVIAIQI